MTLDFLNKKIEKSINDLYNIEIPSKSFQIIKTKIDFEGDFTLIVFPFLSFSKKDLSTTANEIGNSLQEMEEIDSFNVVCGGTNAPFPVTIVNIFPSYASLSIEANTLLLKDSKKLR